MILSCTCKTLRTTNRFTLYCIQQQKAKVSQIYGTSTSDDSDTCAYRRQSWTQVLLKDEQILTRVCVYRNTFTAVDKQSDRASLLHRDFKSKGFSLIANLCIGIIGMWLTRLLSRPRLHFPWNRVLHFCLRTEWLHACSVRHCKWLALAALSGVRCTANTGACTIKNLQS